MDFVGIARQRVLTHFVSIDRWAGRRGESAHLMGKIHGLVSPWL